MVRELQSLAIRTAGDVPRYPKVFWERRFGKAGITLYERAQGIDPREVEPYTPPKSESAETTFDIDTRDIGFLKSWLFRHADRIGRTLRKQRLQGRVITLKIKYADFRIITRRVTLDAPTSATETIYETACDLLDHMRLEEKIRLIGVGVSGFDSPPHQLRLPTIGKDSQSNEERRTKLDKVMDELQDKFGQTSVVRGRLFQQAAQPKMGPDPFPSAGKPPIPLPFFGALLYSSAMNIIIMNNRASFLVSFWSVPISRLQEEGHQVTCLVPAGDSEAEATLKGFGEYPQLSFGQQGAESSP